jgi:hypothetical protein
MASETEREIYRALQENQATYAYYLLTAAGAGIALAVNQTHGANLSITQIPLGLAVLSWAFSFFSGCYFLRYRHAVTSVNAYLFRVQGGGEPKVGTNPQTIATVSNDIRQVMEKHSDKAIRFGKAQFRLLVTGGLLYIVWHILEMQRHWT